MYKEKDRSNSPDDETRVIDFTARPGPVDTRRSTGRTRRITYALLLAKSALVVGLLIAAGIWWIGGYFTIAWLQRIGLPVQTWGLLVWLIPAAITCLEMGMLAARSRIVWLWVFWLGILAFDVYTTVAGMMLVAEGRIIFGFQITATDIIAWQVIGLVGLLIALAPEPAVRSIWQELWR